MDVTFGNLLTALKEGDDLKDRQNDKKRAIIYLFWSEVRSIPIISQSQDRPEEPRVPQDLKMNDMV